MEILYINRIWAKVNHLPPLGFAGLQARVSIINIHGIVDVTCIHPLMSLDHLLTKMLAIGIGYNYVYTAWSVKRHLKDGIYCRLRKMKFHIKKFIIKLSLDVLEIGSLFWLIWNKCEISDPLLGNKCSVLDEVFRYKSKYKNVGVLPIKKAKFNVLGKGPSSERNIHLSDERPTFETLDFLYQQYSNFHAGNPSMCKERGFSF